MNEYDALFLKYARNGFRDLHSTGYKIKDEMALLERKQLLNSMFDFSLKNLERLRYINTVLSEKSQTAYMIAERFEKQITLEMQNLRTFVTCYEITFNVELYSDIKYAQIPDLEGNPFFQYEMRWFEKSIETCEEFRCEHKNWLFNTDHTEVLMEGHPLYDFQHGLLFHELAFHTILSFKDIIEIEDIWIEVILAIQNHNIIRRRK